jgi:hypothetical protein
VNALVVYESMYGNTAAIARAIGRGVGSKGIETLVLPVDEVTPEQAAEVDLLVVGGPTHAHGMSREATRRTAVQDPNNAFEKPTVEPGLRAWLGGLPKGRGHAVAAFDTRFSAPEMFTGSAAKGIARELRRGEYRLCAAPESFFVTKENALADDAAEEATAWAAALAERLLLATTA